MVEMNLKIPEIIFNPLWPSVRTYDLSHPGLQEDLYNWTGAVKGGVRALFPATGTGM